MSDIFMVNDLPSAQDLLKFNRYVAPLARIIKNPESKTPFTIGIFGPWGSGKSTLLQHISKELTQSKALKFFCIDFNPWLYHSEENLIVPLLHTIQSTLEKPSSGVVESAKKIGYVLARVGAALLLKATTVNQVKLEDLEKHEKVYLEQLKRAKSAIKDLRENLQEAVDEITNKGQNGRMVVFIDDLDRCEPDQIVELLEALKLFLDLEHCFFLLALDDEVIYRAIQMKYVNFPFLEDRKAQIGQEYLEKMIQLPLYLYPLSEIEVESYLLELNPPQAVVEHAKLFAEIMFPNPRKIKRILNLFLLNLAVIESNPQLMKEMKVETLARLIVLQVQDYGLYQKILQNEELPEYLSKVYRKEINLDDEPAWVSLKERSKGIRDLCKLYYRPGTWLEHIFKHKNVFPQPMELIQYFNMLGRGARQ